MIGSRTDCIRWLWEQDDSGQYECKKKRKRRSLTANAYYWAMANMLGRTLGISDTEVHLQMLRDYAPAEVLSLRASVNPSDYTPYWDQISLEMVDGEERREIMAYKRSSEMDSSEFAKLIEGLRYECESQGLNVKTPAEIAQLEFIEGKKDG